jgi:hypothetical protein
MRRVLEHADCIATIMRGTNRVSYSSAMTTNGRLRTMRIFKTLVAAAVMLGMGSMAHAELQNVEVGGQIRIRGNWYKYDRFIGETSFVQQRTRLHVKADFTDEVKAFIEFDSYNIWGDSFRSNYITGFDGAGRGNDVNLYQGYIEARQMWGTPLQLRVGRQEISLGSEWLVGTNDNKAFFTGLSFDGIRATYDTDMFSIDAIWAKLAESGGAFGDDDVDFYSVYLSWTGMEDIAIDAYWTFVRDDRFMTAWKVDLHTVGLRGAGTLGAFDFEAEAAYQFGSAKLPAFWWGRTKLDYGSWAGNLELGYTFDMTWQPRVYLGAAYFQGGRERRGDGLWWGGRRTPRLPFNRMFSNWEYGEFLDSTDLSNVIIYRGGLSAMATENVELMLAATHFRADKDHANRAWWWWQRNRSKTLGTEVAIYADYHYTEDLIFRVGYSHFFTSSGVTAGHMISGNGLLPFVADRRRDWNFAFIETEVKF